MGSFKRNIRKNSTLVEIIILLAGIILVLVGRQSSVVAGIGASVIASAIVVFMTDVLLGKDESENLSRWGLEAVYKTRGEMNSSSDVYLDKAKSVKIIAFGLKSWRDSQQKKIRKLLERGGTIQIITMKPECNNLKAREADELQAEGSISHSIRQMIEWAKKENAKGRKGRIEIRQHEHLPLGFVFLMDNRLFTGPYEYGKESQQTISFEYNNTGEAYLYYDSYFDSLWNDSAFCSDALKE